MYSLIILIEEFKNICLKIFTINYKTTRFLDLIEKITKQIPIKKPHLSLMSTIFSCFLIDIYFKYIYYLFNCLFFINQNVKSY